jgi:hypothetical protein
LKTNWTSAHNMVTFIDAIIDIIKELLRSFDNS